jgi:hypothetical protein
LGPLNGNSPFRLHESDPSSTSVRVDLITLPTPTPPPVLEGSRLQRPERFEKPPFEWAEEDIEGEEAEAKAGPAKKGRVEDAAATCARQVVVSVITRAAATDRV